MIIIEPGLIQTAFTKVVLTTVKPSFEKEPYSKLVQKMKNALQKSDIGKGSISTSPPSVVAKTLIKAVQSPNPKTRYRSGKHARLFPFIRLCLSDKVLDYLLLRMIQ